MYRLTHSVAGCSSTEQVEARAFGAECFDVFCADIGGGLHAVEDDLAFVVAAELAYVFVISVEEGGAVAGKSFDQFVLGAGDTGERIEEFKMHGSDVGDDALIGSAMRARAAISPGCDMPISTTARSYSGSSVSRPSGRPKWLLKFPLVR